MVKMVSTTQELSYSRKLFPQWLTGAGVTIIMVELGIMSGWSSPYLALLKRPDSAIPLTDEQVSWVASLLNLGRFLGAICGAFSVNYLGSKKSLLISIVPIGCCWVFTAFAKSEILLYLARSSGGFGIGMVYSCLALYVGEVALPEIRGALVSLAMAGGSTIGVVLSSICGKYLAMDISAAAFLVPCITVGIIFFWLPESPHWLVKIRDHENAKRSIAWYQPGQDVDKELEIIENLVTASSYDTFWKKVKKLKLPPIRKAMLLIIVLFTFMQITGLNSIFFYMEMIIRRSNFKLLDPAVAVICINATGILATALSMCLIDSCGRKFLLILSSSGVALAMAGLGANSYLVSLGRDVTNFQWLPITAILLFVNAYFMGLMSIPSTVLGEIFPADIKCVAGCVASLVGALWSFVATRSFHPMIDGIGEPYVFWMHGTFALLLIPYVIVIMPETKGKSLQDIQYKLIRT